MKVVAFSGSARNDGNTAILVRQVFAEPEKAAIATELVQLAGDGSAGALPATSDGRAGRPLRGPG